MTKNTALITGASEGIGKKLAHIHAPTSSVENVSPDRGKKSLT